MTVPFLKCFFLGLIAITLFSSTVLSESDQPANVPPWHQGSQGESSTASESSQAAPSSQDHFLKSFWRDECQLWTSPARGGTYRSHTVKKYGLPFLLLSAASIGTDRKTGDLLPNTQDQTRWSGRVSQLGASYTLAGISGATLLLGKLKESSHLEETGRLGLQAIAHTQVVVFAIKQITNRERPLVHDGHGSFWKGGNSFPSGHAATSFAVATVFAYEYRDQHAVPIASYALASLVAASRLSAQRHWVSDIFVGGSLGFLIGRYVYKTHHDPNLPGSPVGRSSRLVPQVGFGGRQFFLAWQF
ncbi:MAG: phosphatase PAP2 family protein [Acidobacteriota bacterium]